MSPTSQNSYFAGRSLAAGLALFARFEGKTGPFSTFEGISIGEVRLFMLGDSAPNAGLQAGGGAATTRVGAIVPDGCGCSISPQAGCGGAIFIFLVGGEYCVPLST
jgi:hypothetical protein